MEILNHCIPHLRYYTIWTLKPHIAHGFNHGLDGQNGYNRFNGLNYLKCNFKKKLQQLQFNQCLISFTYKYN